MGFLDKFAKPQNNATLAGINNVKTACKPDGKHQTGHHASTTADGWHRRAIARRGSVTTAFATEHCADLAIEIAHEFVEVRWPLIPAALAPLRIVNRHQHNQCARNALAEKAAE